MLKKIKQNKTACVFNSKRNFRKSHDIVIASHKKRKQDWKFGLIKEIFVRAIETTEPQVSFLEEDSVYEGE